MTHEEAVNLKTFNSYCNCGGYAAKMKGVHENLCPVCGDGILTAHMDLVTVRHKGQEGQIQSHYSTCSTCGVDQIGEQESKRNKRAMNEVTKPIFGGKRND